jgi:iron complex transport system ATP-binding protein
MDLRLEHIQVKFSDIPILKDISLLAKSGTFTGLVGPNGSGKSTLLRTAYQVLKPSGGVILLDGVESRRLSPRQIAQEMAAVGQFNNISYDFKVWEIVLMGRTPHKSLLESDSDKDYTIVEESLRKVGMESYLHRTFFSLSGGEKQRIILARALAQEPKVLILDEPTNHLDIRFQMQILSIVKGLGICVLTALHDLTLATQFCEEIYVLNKGMVVAQGPPDTVLTPQLVKDVFGVACEILHSSVTGEIVIHYHLPRKSNHHTEKEQYA